MELTPESPKGRKVLFFIPAGVRGSGWLALAAACERLFKAAMRVVQTCRNPWQKRGVQQEAASFANIVRGAVNIPAGALRKKISISLAFIGGEGRWENLFKSLEAARRWVQSSEQMVERSVVKREVAGFEMEIQIEVL